MDGWMMDEWMEDLWEDCVLFVACVDRPSLCDQFLSAGGCEIHREDGKTRSVDSTHTHTRGIHYLTVSVVNSPHQKLCTELWTA